MYFTEHRASLGRNFFFLDKFCFYSIERVFYRVIPGCKYASTSYFNLKISFFVALIFGVFRRRALPVRSGWTGRWPDRRHGAVVSEFTGHELVAGGRRVVAVVAGGTRLTRRQVLGARQRVVRVEGAGLARLVVGAHIAGRAQLGQDGVERTDEAGRTDVTLAGVRRTDFVDDEAGVTGRRGHGAYKTSRGLKDV